MCFGCVAAGVGSHDFKYNSIFAIILKIPITGVSLTTRSWSQSLFIIFKLIIFKSWPETDNNKKVFYETTLKISQINTSGRHGHINK